MHSFEALPPLNGLNALIAAAETGSFTAAAELLNILDAKVSGVQVTQRLIGRKPLGSSGLTISGAINWNLPWIEGLSFDLTYEGFTDRVADRANSYVIPSRVVASVGGRYRFDVSGRPATFRAQWASANNSYGYGNLGEGFYYNAPRRLQISLTVDM